MQGLIITAHAYGAKVQLTVSDPVDLAPAATDEKGQMEREAIAFTRELLGKQFKELFEAVNKDLAGRMRAKFRESEPDEAKEGA